MSPHAPRSKSPTKGKQPQLNHQHSTANNKTYVQVGQNKLVANKKGSSGDVNVNVNKQQQTVAKKTTTGTKKKTSKRRIHKNTSKLMKTLPPRTGTASTRNKVPWYKISYKKLCTQSAPQNAHHDTPFGHTAPEPMANNSSSLNSPPLENIPEHRMKLLDEELAQFEYYVRLTPMEVQARNSVVDQIEAVAAKRLATDVALQPFGSFANPSVCCFTSDMDLAVEGVIGPLNTMPPQSMKRKRDHIDPSNTTATTTISSTHIIHSPTQDTATRSSSSSTAMAVIPSSPSQDELKKKEMRRKRWKEALEAMDRANDYAQGSPVVVNHGEVTTEADNTTTDTTELENNNQSAKECGAFQISICNGSSSALMISDSDTLTIPDNQLFILDTKGLESEGNCASVPAVSTALIVGASAGRDDDDDDCEDSADKLAPLMLQGNVDCMLDDNQISNEKGASDDVLDDARPSTGTLSDFESNSNDSECGLDDEIEILEVKVDSIIAQSVDDLHTNKRTREMSLYALKGMRNKLRKISKQCQLIPAKVPIIKLTMPAFEVDIAIAGCTGIDTSSFAGSQAMRYRSFAPVVIFLKILLSQHKLDVPFEGGLGSFKVYVLVAYGIEQHLKHGGNDRPSEILLSVLFRYGVQRNGLKNFRTPLSLESVLDCAGYSADFSNVHMIKECRKLFGECWSRLRWKMLRRQDKLPVSLLDTVIDVDRLRLHREMCIHMSAPNRMSL